MKKITLLLVASLGLASQITQAETINLAQLQHQLNQLEAQIDHSKDENNINFHGLIEIESIHTNHDNMDKNTSSNLALATFELAAEATLNPFTSASATLLYEEGDTPLDIETAVIVFSNGEKPPVSMTLGQTYIPFGAYETALINDTLALELAETLRTIAMLAYAEGGFSANIYTFNNKDGNQLNQLGAHIGYDNNYFCLGLDYADNTDNEIAGHKPATGIHGCAHVGDFTLNAEYLQLGQISKGQNKLDISATQAELSYTLNSLTLGVAYQKTSDALTLELPKQRISLAAAMNFYGNTQVAIEYWHNNDYSIAKGGTSRDSNNLVVQVAVAF